MTIPSPIRPWQQRIPGFVAGSRLTHHGRLTALRLRSKWSRTYGFHQTPPRGTLGQHAPKALRCSAAAPLPRRTRVPSVRAPGQDLR